LVVVALCLGVVGTTLAVVGNAVPAAICIAGAVFLLMVGGRGLYRNRR